MLIDWLCFRIVMAWPIPLPDCRESRTFSWILARAGRHANKTPNVRGNAHLTAAQEVEDDQE